MSENPWLTILGLGEDGPDGLPPASLAALRAAEIIVGPPRHLALLPPVKAQKLEWPVPFADGIELLTGLRGRKVVMLASGNPFWFGAGSVIARKIGREEWRALPGPSVFSLAASRLGWPLEATPCFGLHAAPLTRLRPSLVPGAKLLTTLRDGDAVGELAGMLSASGFGESRLTVFEALGGDRENRREFKARDQVAASFAHPVCAAIEVSGSGTVMPATAGRPDALFENDGQMTKRPVRALTLSALAPRPFDYLWDIGGGSGSVAIEWLLAHPTTDAVSIESRADRAERIRGNAASLGVDRLEVVEGSAPDALASLRDPDAVFVGGGLSEDLLNTLAQRLATGTRLVANAVTLESEALLARWHGKLGGELTRIELATAVPLGTRQGWRSSYPVVQWSVTL